MRSWRYALIAAFVAAAAFAAVELRVAVAAAKHDGGDPQKVVSSLVPFRPFW